MIPRVECPAALRENAFVRELTRTWPSQKHIADKKCALRFLDYVNAAIGADARSQLQAPLSKHGMMIVDNITTSDHILLLATLSILGTPDVCGNENPAQLVYEIRTQYESFGPLSRRHVEFGLHTDCSILPVPPRIVALACVRPDVQGGVSLLVDGNDVVPALSEDDVRLLRQARYTGPRAEHNALPILFQVDDLAEALGDDAHHMSGQSGTLGIRYRRTLLEAAEGDVAAARALDALTVTIDDTQRVTAHLGSGEVLVFDNYRFLHGRTGFAKNSPRLLNRVRLSAGPFLGRNSR